MQKILCIGECLIDFIGVKHELGIKEQPLFEKKFGGAPANVASVIASLGGDVQLFTAIGQDEFGDFLEANLKKFGVDTTFVFREPTPTTLAFVSLDKVGERDFVFVPGAGYNFDFSQIDNQLLESVDIMHFGGALALNLEKTKHTYFALAERAKKLGKYICYDPNYRSVFWSDKVAQFADEAFKFMKLADLIKLSDEEAQIVTKQDNLLDAVSVLKNEFDGLILITLGAEGARFIQGALDVLVPVKQVDSIDTTGAGDAFIGALLYQMAKEDILNTSNDEKMLKKWVKEANNVASNVCTVRGALGYFEIN